MRLKSVAALDVSWSAATLVSLVKYLSPALASELSSADCAFIEFPSVVLERSLASIPDVAKNESSPVRQLMLLLNGTELAVASDFN